MAFVQLMKDNAKEDYHLAVQVWAAKSAFGGGKPPAIPLLLR